MTVYEICFILTSLFSYKSFNFFLPCYNQMELASQSSVSNLIIKLLSNSLINILICVSRLAAFENSRFPTCNSEIYKKHCFLFLWKKVLSFNLNLCTKLSTRLLSKRQNTSVNYWNIIRNFLRKRIRKLNWRINLSFFNMFSLDFSFSLPWFLANVLYLRRSFVRDEKSLLFHCSDYHWLSMICVNDCFDGNRLFSPWVGKAA